MEDHQLGKRASRPPLMLEYVQPGQSVDALRPGVPRVALGGNGPAGNIGIQAREGTATEVDRRSPPRSYSSCMSTISQMELDTEEKLMTIRHQMQEEIADIGDRVEQLNLDISLGVDPEAKKTEVQRLELIKAQRERKLARIVQKEHELLEFNRKRAIEEEQGFMGNSNSNEFSQTSPPQSDSTSRGAGSEQQIFGDESQHSSSSSDPAYLRDALHAMDHAPTQSGTPHQSNGFNPAQGTTIPVSVAPASGTTSMPAQNYGSASVSDGGGGGASGSAGSGGAAIGSARGGGGASGSSGGGSGASGIVRTDGGASVVMQQNTAGLDQKDALLVQLLQQQMELLRRPPDREWEPKDLPQFDGKAERWPIFHAELKRTTPAGKMNSSQNAIRLRRALVGVARDTVIGLLNDPLNVSKCIDMLERRFGRNDLVVDALIAKAEAAKSPDINKPDTFVTYGIAVQQLIQQLKMLNDPSFLNDRSLLKKLTSKLPVTLATDWHTWLRTQPLLSQNLESFGTWMDAKMSIYMEMATPFVEVIREDKRGHRGKGAVIAAAAEDGDSKESKCLKCAGNHRLAACFRFEKMAIEERVKLAKDNRLCFRCLKGGHNLKDCRSQNLCSIKDCGRKHHPLLHGDTSWKKQKWRRRNDGPANEAAEVAIPSTNIEEVRHTAGAAIAQSKPLSVLRVRVKGPRGTRKVFVGLDSQSSVTLINEKLAADIGLDGPSFRHRITGVGAKETSGEAKLVNLQIGGCFPGAELFSVEGAWTMPAIGLPPYSQDAESAKQRWPHLRKAKLENFQNAKIDMLIGEDHPFLTAHRHILEGGPKEPMAKKTVLGWVLGGKQLTTGVEASVTAAACISNEDLDRLLREAYQLEAFGIIESGSGATREEEKALQLLEDGVKLNGDRWEAPLLWRSSEVVLPDSRAAAMSRLYSNERKMKKDPWYAAKYSEKFKEYLQKGYLRELTPEEAARKSPRTNYIPHFGHFNPNKPDRIRLVFDAASKVEGVSLNDNLLTGPDLIRPLPAVLMNYRRHNVVIQGDIDDMFPRVEMRKEDQDSQRLLFRDVAAGETEIKEYVMTVLIFGAKCSPSTAIYVKNINARRFKEQHPEAVRAIHEDFYVDDCLTGAVTVDAALTLRKEIVDINAAGSLHVRKWHSNSLKVLNAIPSDERAAGVKTISTGDGIPAEKVLGMLWDPMDDCFTFSTNFKKVRKEILQGSRPTKRELCSLLMSVFDPLGFLGNLKIRGMILLQQTWKHGIDWDEPITENTFEDWREFVQNLKRTIEIRIPRPYRLDIHAASSVQLHVMVDSSEEACCVVCYLRVELEGQVSVSFVASRVKVAPVRKQTIPRLELVAAVMGSLLAHTICSELRVPITRRVLWSDSRTVLCWIRSDVLKYKEFVGNRISKIHELTNVTEWRWIPTVENVADEGTRLKSPLELSSDSRWLNGPAFLREDCSDWPKERDGETPELPAEEIRSSAVAALGDPLGVGVSIDDTCGLSEDKQISSWISRFSSYNKMIRTWAAVRKAARHWIDTVRKLPTTARWTLASDLPKRGKKETAAEFQKKLASSLVKATSFFAPAEINEAELSLVRLVQLEAFSEEFSGSKRKKAVGRLRILSHKFENGIIRLDGRIAAANVPSNVKWPIIIPNDHPFTELLVMREHERCAHQGKATVLSNLRQDYWILRGKTTVNKVVAKCQLCRVRGAKPIIPRMGDLPLTRLAAGHPPYTFTGVDLFGPIEVTVGRHHEKRWVMLLTCLVTRHVHLEVVHSLSTDQTLMAFTRFMAIYGKPSRVLSDNGTNFVGAWRVISEAWNDVDWTRIAQADKFQQIEWTFIPPLSPHFGGAWERMVQSIKRVLKTTLTHKFPLDATLLTVLREAQGIVNNRPLSAISDDPADPSPLTPNHFVRGFADVGPIIPANYEEADELRREQWKRAQIHLDHFWQRWTREILPEMAKRQKWIEDNESLKVGDLVLSVDEKQPRNVWQRGVVTKVLPSEDGRVRKVEVTEKDLSGVEGIDIKKAKVKTFLRGVDKLCPLGLSMEKMGTIFRGRCHEKSAKVPGHVDARDPQPRMRGLSMPCDEGNASSSGEAESK